MFCRVIPRSPTGRTNMSYSNSRDYDRATAKRAEWSSWGSRPDTEKEVADKALKLTDCLAFLADVRSGIPADDALDAHPAAQHAYDQEDWSTADTGDIELAEKNCRELFAVRL